MRCRHDRSNIEYAETTFGKQDESFRIKKMVKIEFYLPHDELIDGKSRRPSSSIHRALTWRRRTPTAAAERMMPAAGMRTASEKSWQLSTSSPASSRASDGARVLTRWRGGRRFS